MKYQWTEDKHPTTDELIALANPTPISGSQRTWGSIAIAIVFLLIAAALGGIR